MGTIQGLRAPSCTLPRLLFTLLATFSLLASQLIVLHVTPADAATVGPGVDGLGFEIDGNFTVDTPGNKDWVSQPYTTIPDDDNLDFEGGSKENDRAGWSFDAENPPPKADLLRLYADVELAETDAWLRIGAERASGTGDTWTSFELNQTNPGPFVGSTTVPRTPEDGDLLVTFKFPGNVGTPPEVEVYQWNGGSWTSAAVGTAYGAANAVALTNPTGQTLDPREFLELSIDVGFLFGPDAPCLNFSQAWARSRSSNSSSAQLQDLVSPFAFGFNTCADLTLRKQDTLGSGQAGVTFDLYEGTDTTGTPIDSCTTAASGDCPAFVDLEPGTYTAYEVAPPVGFKLSEEGRTQTVTLQRFEKRTITFTNPPITYLIEVTPPDETNAVGYTHVFTVALTADFIYDYDGDTFQESGVPDLPLVGETIALGWTGPDGSGIVDVDGDELDPPATSATCTTDAHGLCEVTVVSHTVGGPGTLTASHTTPLSGPAASDPPNTTGGGYFSSISDTGDKSWIGYLAILDGEFHNPLGVDHTFTAAVERVNADLSTAPAVGVEVTFAWDGPAGSGFAGGVDTCTTGAAGTCEVTVTSPDVAGTGTLTIIEVSGEILTDQLLEITYEGDDAPSATKTWWDYRVTVEDDATNPVHESHTFTITVERTDGSTGAEGAIWLPALDGTTVDLSWSGVGSVDSETCSDPGTVDGVCEATVSSSVKGTGTLTATGITTTLGGYNLDDGVPQPFAFDVDDDSASKAWVDWLIGITPDALNPSGTLHTFTVDVSVWDVDAGDYVPVPDGTTLTLSYSDATLVEDDDSCTVTGTVDGSCTITAQADVAAALTVTVTGIEGTDLPGYPDGTASFVFPEADQVSSTKQWIDLRILPDADAINYVADDHTFTLIAQRSTVPPDERDDDPDSADWTAVPDGTILDVEVAAGGVGSITGGTCLTTGTEDGSCTVVVSSGGETGSLTVIADGMEITLFDGVADTAFDVTVDPAEQTKTWIDYVVELDGEAWNLLGEDHTFTANISRTPEVALPLSGITLTFAYWAPDAAVAETLSCTTDATGTCTVTVSSPGVPGTGTLILTDITDPAVPSDAVDVDTVTYVDGREVAEKTWVAYRIGVDPPDDINPANVDGSDDPDRPSLHTFTITVERAEASGEGPIWPPLWDPFEGATISGDQLVWERWDSTAASWVPDDLGDVLVEETCSDPGTDADGACTVTVDSTETGRWRLSVASITAPIAPDGEPVDIAPYLAAQEVDPGAALDLGAAQGIKTWTTFALVVTPDIAFNALPDDDTHVFTVLLTEDRGDGFVGVPGAVILLELDGPGTVTLGGGVQLVGEDLACITDADGICDVEVTNTEPGTTTLTASYLAMIGDASVTFEADAAIKHWAAIELVKEAQVDQDAEGNRIVFVDEGETATVVYDYTITNVGPVPLLVTSLDDDVIGAIELPEALVLGPGESTVVSATYTLTAADIAAGEVENVAIVTGETEDGTEVTATDDEQVFVVEVLAAVPGVSIVKSAVGLDTDDEGNLVVRVGSGETTTITYTFLVINTGEEPLVDLTLVDDRIGDLSDELTTALIAAHGAPVLPVAGSVTVTATYTTTAADLDDGEVVNVGAVTAVGATSGVAVGAEDTETVFLVEVLEAVLPVTGADSARLLGIGLVMAALGAALLLFIPRRRRGALG